MRDDESGQFHPEIAAAAIFPAATQPVLEYAFSASVAVAEPIEIGVADGGRRRFIAIEGGEVTGPALTGVVLPGGGDWQVIEDSGLTRVEARYFLKSSCGTVIEVTNPGIRVATPDVTDRMARGEAVDAGAYYFRTTPRFAVADGPFGWMRRCVFIGRGVRKPDRVLIDFHIVR